MRDQLKRLDEEDSTVITSNVLERSALELEQQISVHRQLLACVLKQQEGGAKDFTEQNYLQMDSNKFRRIIVETIEVIENTRRAFKSKQLEALRKKLIVALAE